MDEKKLGGIPLEFYKNREIEKIIPSLKGVTRIRTARRMRILKGHETLYEAHKIIDELFFTEVLTKYHAHLRDYHRTSTQRAYLLDDIKRDCQGTPTAWAYLLEDIKKEYSKLSERGNTHYGGHATIEPLFKYLLYKHSLKYLECERRINLSCSEVIASENAVWMLLNPDKYRNAKQLLQTRKVQFQIPHIQDLAFVQVFFALEKWRKSFSLPCIPIGNVAILYSLLHITLRKGNALRERVAEEGLTDKKGIYPCLMIYAIKSLEQEAKVKVLKTDRELSEIWGISPKTFERRMSTLLSIDC